MLSGFQEGPFVTSLLAKLTRVPAFRVSIIEQEPAILERLLNISAINEVSDIELDALSVQHTLITLLSEPLPSSAALPAPIHGFLHQLLDRMTRIQDVESIRAVYQVLYGQSTSLLEVVSPELFESFATTCNRILRNNTDHVRNVLCLAIYALVARETRSGSLSSSINSSGNTQPSPFLERWRDSTKKFFYGDKAVKTTSLTVVRVLHFCAGDAEISCEEASESLLLCTRILQSIDRAAIIQWTVESDKVLRKLEEKLISGRLQTDIAITVSLRPTCSELAWPMASLG